MSANRYRISTIESTGFAILPFEAANPELTERCVTVHVAMAGANAWRGLGHLH
jgi:hypothetical protein